MTFTISHLGPAGTYTEQAAQAYAHWWATQTQQSLPQLLPQASIGQSLQAVAQAQAEVAIVPVENSIEGSVTTTLDTLWQLDDLNIRQGLVLPILHVVVSQAEQWETVQTIYSHPQALGQCQQWLQKWVPHAEQIPVNSTTDALKYVANDATVAAISSEPAAQLYDLPIRAYSIQDYPENCTRFLVVSRLHCDIAIPEVPQGQLYTSLAFSLLKNVPGALVTPLQIFAQRNINLSRIESRPTKRSLGDYVFFIDAEADFNGEPMQAALALLKTYTERLRVLGNYAILPTPTMQTQTDPNQQTSP